MTPKKDVIIWPRGNSDLTEKVILIWSRGNSGRNTYKKRSPSKNCYFFGDELSFSGPVCFDE